MSDLAIGALRELVIAAVIGGGLSAAFLCFYIAFLIIRGWKPRRSPGGWSQ